MRKGQSINQILANHRKEIGLSEKTLYNYVSANVFGVQDIHLPRKVSYRPRKNNRPVLTHAEYKYRRGRTIEGFEAFRAENPELPAVEMDTVKSARGCRKCLLTFTFEKSNFLILMFDLQEYFQQELVILSQVYGHLLKMLQDTAKSHPKLYGMMREYFTTFVKYNPETKGLLNKNLTKQQMQVRSLPLRLC